jgi:D-arabinono-1,4-lactone oxidase/Protein of unknown function (DUF3892)
VPCPADEFSGDEFQSWPFRNWLGNVSVPSERHYVPDSLESLVWVVAEAAKNDRRLRAIGRGWSFENIAAAYVPPSVPSVPATESTGWTVSLEKLAAFKDEIVSGTDSALTDAWRQLTTDSDLKKRRALVCVEAGIRLRALNLALDERGLAMISLGGSQGQALAGVASTSTHGSDIDLPPVCDLIRAVHLVTVGGREMWIESSSEPLTEDARLRKHVPCNDLEIVRDDELLRAVQVGVGCFGIEYAAVLEVREKFGLYEQSVKLAWDDVASALRSGAGSATPLQPLLDTLSAPNHTEVVGDPDRPRFLELLLSSRSRGACHVRRRWETSASVTDLASDSSAFYCDPAPAAVILHTAASTLRVMAATVALIPIVGAARALELTARSLDLDGLSLATAAGGVSGGEALTTACSAIWWASADISGEIIDWLAQVLVDNFSSKKNGVAGPSWQMMTGVGEGGDPCERVFSAEIVFDLQSPAYVDFVDWLLTEGREYRQAGYISIRFSKPSQALLSMHNLSGQHVVSIEVASPLGFDQNTTWFEALEAQALSLGGRPHWGQLNRLKTHQVRRLYDDQLLDWRAQLGRVTGVAARDFLNNYAEQRGLTPIAPLRRVTAVKRAHGRITDIGDPASDWSVSVEGAIEDIERGGATYYIEPTPEWRRNLIFVRRVLTTAPDETAANNLDSLPDGDHVDAFAPSTAFFRRVTSVERDSNGDTVFLNNDDDRWSVLATVAWREISSSVASYYIQTTPGEQNTLLALAYLTTAPDRWTKNNLENLPNADL